MAEGGTVFSSDDGPGHRRLYPHGDRPVRGPRGLLEGHLAGSAVADAPRGLARDAPPRTWPPAPHIPQLAAAALPAAFQAARYKATGLDGWTAKELAAAPEAFLVSLAQLLQYVEAGEAPWPDALRQGDKPTVQKRVTRWDRRPFVQAAYFRSPTGLGVRFGSCICGAGWRRMCRPPFKVSCQAERR